MTMHHPPYPGEAVLGLCLEPFELPIASTAAQLQVDEEYLVNLCAGLEQITAELAIRMEQAFGGTAVNLRRLQAAY